MIIYKKKKYICDIYPFPEIFDIANIGQDSKQLSEKIKLSVMIIRC